MFRRGPVDHVRDNRRGSRLVRDRIVAQRQSAQAGGNMTDDDARVTGAPLARIGINRLHYPVSTLGWGVRAGIWTQGCSIGCAGCVSVDTWAPSEQLVSAKDVVSALRDLVGSERLDGVTVSGGEPFDQPEGLLGLVRELRDWLGPERDILLFTGYPLARIESRHTDVLASADAVVAGPYVEHRPWDGPTIRNSAR